MRSGIDSTINATRTNFPLFEQNKNASIANDSLKNIISTCTIEKNADLNKVIKENTYNIIDKTLIGTSIIQSIDDDDEVDGDDDLIVELLNTSGYNIPEMEHSTTKNGKRKLSSESPLRSNNKPNGAWDFPLIGPKNEKMDDFIL